MKKVLLYSIIAVLLLNAQHLAAAWRSHQHSNLAVWGDRAFKPTSRTALSAVPAVPAVPAAPMLPADTSSTAIAHALAAAGLDTAPAALYLSVQLQSGTPWQLLAAVHLAETHQSPSTNRTSPAGATGPMQFMPATFRAYGVDGNGDGTRNASNLEDAMASAGHYLASNGAAQGDYRTALYRYNHSWRYVNQVLATARKLGLQ
jgi:hypothetical protein